MTTKNLPTNTKKSEVPAFMKKDGALGADTIGVEDIIVPRLKIVQGLSNVKEVNEDLKDGEWYNSVDAKGYGKKIKIHILLFWSSKIWFDDSQNFLGSEFYDQSTGQYIRVGDIDFDNASVRANAKDCYNYMVASANQVSAAATKGTVPEILIYTAMSAAQKPARKLNSFLKANARNGEPIFARELTCGVAMEKFATGKAYMPVFELGDFVGEGEYAVLKALHTECVKMQGEASTHKESSETKQAPLTTGGVESEVDDNGEIDVDDIFSKANQE